MTDLQTLSDDELRDLYARSHGGGGASNTGPDTSWVDPRPIDVSTKDQSRLAPLPARPLASPGSQGAIPAAGQQQYPPSVGAGSTGRVAPVFDDVEARAPRPQLQAGLDARAGAAAGLQGMSDDDLKALYQQTKGPGAGITRNVAAGLNNALYATAGAPVDLVTWGINRGVQGINAATGANLSEIRDPIGGSQSIANAFGAIGVDDPANVKANTTEERIARGVGEGIGYTVGPQAAVGGLAKASALSPEATAAAFNLLGWPNSTAAVAGNAVAGGAAGGGSVAAMEATPDRYDPLSGLAGGMAGGAVGTLASGLPRLANEGVRLARDWAAPLTKGGREEMAGRVLRDAATDPSAARAALDEPSTLVPGSKPTTFQQTGDMGLGALERRAQTMDPAAFNQRRADQNAARIDSLGKIQPEGNPQAITQAFRSRLADIDQQTDAAVQAATQAARGKTQALGGNGSAETYGDTLRTSLRDAETRARESERALWKAVDPEGRLALQSDNIKSTAVGIRKEMPETAKPMEGEEAAIFDVASRLRPAISFNAMSALRSRVSTLMRQELMTNGQSPTYARLSRLRGAVEQDVEGVLSQKAAQEAEAVATGAMREEDTIAARLSGWRDGWREEQATRARSGFGAGPDAAGGASGFSGPRGGAGEVGGGLSGPSGATRVQGNPGGSVGSESLVPNFDDAARGRLAAANEATKQRARTFNEGPAGSILRRSGNDGPYRLQNAAVPERIFFPGGKSAENIKRFRKAVGDDRAMGHLADYAVSSMRRAAETPEGIIDPKRLEAWKRRHADALKEFPALNAKFADATRASEAAIEAGTLRAQQLDNYQKGLVGKLLGADNPDDITKMVGSVFGRQDSVSLMGRLAAETNTNPEARAGLRKAVIDHMLGRLVSNTEAATSGQTLLKSDQFQSFIKQNRPVLRRIFSDTELQRMQAVADDLQQANRSIVAVKLPGSPGTAQDTFAVGKGDNGKTILSKIILSAAASTGAAGLALGPAAGFATLGAGAFMAMRQAGINTVDDLVRDALLHPDRAALLLQKGSFKPGTGPAVALMKRYKQAAVTGAATTRDEGPGGTKRNEPLQVTVTQPANWVEALTASEPDSIIGKLSGDRDYAKALGLDR